MTRVWGVFQGKKTLLDNRDNHTDGFEGFPFFFKDLLMFLMSFEVFGGFNTLKNDPGGWVLLGGKNAPAKQPLQPHRWLRGHSSLN